MSFISLNLHMNLTLEALLVTILKYYKCHDIALLESVCGPHVEVVLSKSTSLCREIVRY